MTHVALVGCGHIHTPGFVKRLQNRSDITVRAVWDHDRARAEKRAAELNAPVVDDLDAIWGDERIRAAIICSETDRHADLVRSAAGAGKHMFVEKPLGLGKDDAYPMADAIKRAGLLFQTGYFQRGIPAHLFLKQEVEKGTFGKITRVRASNCHSGALGDWFTPEWLWMTDPAQAGVGAFGDLGTHALDLLLWIFGGVDRVTATLGSAINRYGPGCDETGEALMIFESGVIGTLAAGWVDVADPITFEISGTEGHAYILDRSEVFIKSSHLEGADGKRAWTVLPTAWPHAFELFLDAVNGASVPLVDAHEAAYRSAVMEAMYMGAKEKSWVNLR
ncbi:MAG: Gfo/Idh/MocA family oxidoreductase [Caldilineaceae bacterium]|nr:Gfo/Idh/MocA family oxidoreductase [Caldilineaceae bacterium]